VASVRRALIAFVLAAAGLLLRAGPAAAHPGIENPFVPAHVETTLALGVPSEESSPMVEVDVTLPPDFTVTRVDSLPGWQRQSGPRLLRYLQGNVPQGGYAQFVFSGVFAQKGVAVLAVVTKAADGTTVDWNQAQGGARPAAVAFPGYPPGSAPVPGVSLSGSAGRGPGLGIASGAAVGFGLLGLGLVRARRKRRLPGQVPEAARG
jgi:hypothetical protein